MALIIYVLLVNIAQFTGALDPYTAPPTVNDTESSTARQGWTSQPNGRGTIDILWSCCFTMFLCSWSILCLNTPGPHETKTKILWRKLAMTILGILCPEIIFGIACGQWIAARQSVKDFETAGFGCGKRNDGWSRLRRANSPLIEGLQPLESQSREGWTMEKAFFAEMGGFRLHTRDQRPFPIDSKVLLYLIRKEYIQLPDVKLRVIQDKNKADGLLRTIVLCQILWFLVGVIGRLAQRLVVTTAELTTVSYILCGAGTAFCWWHKPADIVTAETIFTDYSWNEMLHAADQPLDTWKSTPFDFVNRREWWWSKAWQNFVNILRHLHLNFGSNSVPIDRFADSSQKILPNTAIFVVIGLTYCFFSVLFVGWNYSFPSHIEQMLWRAACLTMMITLTGLLISAQLALTYHKLQERFHRAFAMNTIRRRCVDTSFRIERVVTETSAFQKFNKGFDCVRNNSKEKDPQLQIKLRSILALYLIGSFYLFARAYIIIADVIELRSLPPSAYDSVNWQNYWPHIG